MVWWNAFLIFLDDNKRNNFLLHWSWLQNSSWIPSRQRCSRTWRGLHWDGAEFAVVVHFLCCNWLQEKSLLPVPRRKGLRQGSLLSPITSASFTSSVISLQSWAEWKWVHDTYLTLKVSLLLHKALSPAQFYHCYLLNRSGWGFWAELCSLTVRELFFGLVVCTISKGIGPFPWSSVLKREGGVCDIFILLPYDFMRSQTNWCWFEQPCEVGRKAYLHSLQ